MAKIAIPIVRVMCEDGSNDYNVGLNPNTNTPEKVQVYITREQISVHG